jgi:hypothetical protein
LLGDLPSECSSLFVVLKFRAELMKINGCHVITIAAI